MDSNATSNLHKAHELIKAGRAQEALALLTPLVRADPESAEAWYLLGRALREPEKKLYAFRQVLRIDPANPAAHRQVAALTDVAPTRGPSAPQNRAGRLALVLVAGALVLLVAIFGVGLWLVQPGSPLAGGVPPTEAVRHPGQATTLPFAKSRTPDLRPTVTPTATPTLTPFPTSLVAPAPTADAAPNLAIFNNEDILWQAGTAFTEKISGHLGAGESLSIPFEIDEPGEVSFMLQWTGEEEPVYTLTDPGGRLVDEAYVKAHPEEVSLGKLAALGGILYQFKKTTPGVWKFNLAASMAGEYGVSALINAYGMLFLTAPDRLTYFPGEIATFGAKLQENGSGLAGAAITVRVHLPDNRVETLELTDLGEGLYVAAYKIPAVKSGYATIELVAKGKRNGVNFNRQAFRVIQVAPDTIKLSGVYHETPRDENGDGKYEKLDLSIGLNLTAPGFYGVTANMFADGHLLVGMANTHLELQAGAQTVTISFSGGDIAERKLDGPYTLEIFVVDINTGIGVQEAEYTTALYKHGEFTK